MRGHEKIIELRRRGVTPEHVFLDDWPKSLDGVIDEVDVSADAPGLCDLRFLVGLNVHIASADERRAKAFCEAAMRASAALVIATYSPMEDWVRSSWVRVCVRDADGWREN